MWDTKQRLNASQKRIIIIQGRRDKEYTEKVRLGKREDMYNYKEK